MFPAPTPLGELDQIVGRVAAHKKRWLSISHAQRVRLLEQLLHHTHEQSADIVAKAMHVKGLERSHPSYGEDWMSFAAVTLSCISLLADSYRQLRDEGCLRIPGPVGRRPTGQVAVQVYPGRIWDRLLFMGFRGSVIMQPGVEPDALPDTMGVELREPTAGGALCFVLGAGNVASIPFMDSLYKLFVENQVVVVKLNPVNAYIGPHLRQAFRPLVDAGFFDVVYGGAEVGERGCNHPDVDTLHITGSGETHDAVVWGPPEGRASRKAAGLRLNQRPITSELGNVTPIVVVPGPWTEADLAAQAINIVSMVTNNASFNCIAGKLLITAQGWPLRERLLLHVREAFRRVPARRSYYPGARSRWQRFVDAHPAAERLVDHADDALPWTLIADLDPRRTDDICFTTEPFCALLSEVPLPVDGAGEFIPAAVAFCNDVAWGTLSSSILIHPASRRDPEVEGALERAVDDLRYGCVVVNHWAGIPYAFSAFPWGAFPGHTPEEVGSGIGVVHNAHMFERTQKSVLEGPFRVFPRPPWFINHRRAGAVGRRLADFEAAPSLLRLLPVTWNAIRG